MKTMKTTDLRPHPANATIYGDGVDAGFIENVKTVGVLTPLLVTTDGRIIGGHRRWRAAQEAGFAEVPTVPFASTDEDEILEALVLSNRDSRQRTNEQIGREIRVLEEIAFRRPKKASGWEQRRKRLEIFNRSSSTIEDPATIQRPADTSIDIASRQMGMSRFKGYRLIDSVNAIDHLTAQGKTAEASAVRAALEKSANTGKRMADQLAPESIKRRVLRTKSPRATVEKRKNRPRGNYEKAVFYFNHLTYSEKVRFFDMVKLDMGPRPTPKRVPPAPAGFPTISHEELLKHRTKDETGH
jgi:ParB-like chromosome segregation protein Spo0J